MQASGSTAGTVSRAVPGLGSADGEAPISAAWFEAAICRNCDAALTTPYCAQCGQKAAKRLSLKDAGREGWERVRVYEHVQAKTLGRLVLSPGVVARDYVLRLPST